MDTINSAMVDLAAQLTALAVKGTATAVTNKIRTVKDVKESEKLRSIYDEVVNELLYERDEAVRIAQAYKSEIDRIIISDDDINHLHATVSNVLEILKGFSPDMDVEVFEQFKSLISVDTLKTMQLLGFNYKAAIGEPLTKICSDTICTWGQKNKPSGGNNPKRK